MITLEEAFQKKVKLKNLEQQISSGELSLFERCEVEDARLELKEQLGQFDRAKGNEDGECLYCSG